MEPAVFLRPRPAAGSIQQRRRPEVTVHVAPVCYTRETVVEEGRKAVLIQERDGTIIRLLSPPSDTDRQSVQVEVAPDDVEHQGSLFDRLIEYAFTTLGARFLEVRITTGEE